MGSVESLVQAALMARGRCDVIDLNLDWPGPRPKRLVGASACEEWAQVLDAVRSISGQVGIPGSFFLSVKEFWSVLQFLAS